MITYQALYRKYRPRTFDEVVGQGHITNTIKRQVSMGRLSHAYLFTGTRGTGKTTCAKILARAVNCEHPEDGNPCNACPSCLGIENGSILDVLELDAASNNGVDQVRALRDEAVYTPAAVKKRVYIIDEVHMLSTAAFNALLKILEEPPAHLMFILATTEQHKVLATIQSRCQQFAFKRILPGEISARLLEVAQKEAISLTPEGADLLARLADGGLRDALSLLDQCAAAGGVGEEEILATLGLMGNLETAALMERVAQGDIPGALAAVDRLYAAGKDMGGLLGELSVLARDLLIAHTAPEGGGVLLTGGYDGATMKRLARLLTPPRLIQMLEQLQRTQGELARSANRRTEVELCLFRLCDETQDASAAGILARLTRLEGLIASPPKAERSERTEEPPPPIPPEAAEEQDELPPWDIAQPEPSIPSRAEPEEVPPGAQPVEPTVKEAPPPPSPRRAEVRQRAGCLWPAVLAALKGKVKPGEYANLSNRELVQGRLEGTQFTLWVGEAFLKDMFQAGKVSERIEAQVKDMTGTAVRCKITLGKAPEEPAGETPEQEVPAGEPPAGHDTMDDLIALGAQFDNIIITE